MLNPLKKTKNAWSLIFLIAKFNQLVGFYILFIFKAFSF